MRVVALAVLSLALLAGPDATAAADVSACGAPYGWPVRPSDRAHPVRGGLNDPRNEAFHFGVDITALDGTRVYAVAPGRVHYSRGHRTAIAVRDPSACRWFAYWHVVPAVRSGTRVRRGDLVGRVVRGYNHVHLGEYDRRLGRYVDPTRPGRAGLFPYHDPTRPEIVRVSAERGGRVLDPRGLRGIVGLVVRTHDLPALPSPPPWDGYRVAPATIGWRLVGLRGSVVRPYRRVFDGRVKLDDRLFEAVYAPGTRHPRPRRPGLYRYWLARRFDTDAHANGRYVVRVRVADAHGNAAWASLAVTIRN